MVSIAFRRLGTSFTLPPLIGWFVLGGYISEVGGMWDGGSWGRKLGEGICFPGLEYHRAFSSGEERLLAPSNIGPPSPYPVL